MCGFPKGEGQESAPDESAQTQAGKRRSSSFDIACVDLAPLAGLQAGTGRTYIAEEHCAEALTHLLSVIEVPAHASKVKIPAR